MFKRVIAIVLDSLGFDALINAASYEIFGATVIAYYCSIIKRILLPTLEQMG
jgi:phosphopentomutase